MPSRPSRTEPSECAGPRRPAQTPGRDVGLDAITVLVINYKTLEVTRRCLDSLVRAYPGVRLLIIDNGSNDESTAYIRDLSRGSRHVACVLNERNIYHGPAMHQGVAASQTPYVFTLDSDCEV